MNSAPTAYSPGLGRLKPSMSAFLAKNLCGICTRMPAPSPARGSAPTAPRCSRLQRIASASSTSLCDLRALDVGDEADAAGILLERGIVQALRFLDLFCALEFRAHLLPRLSAHLPRPQRLVASRRRAHRWSLAASSLAPSSVWQLMLGGLAAMTPLSMAPLIIVRYGPDDKPAKDPGGPPRSQTKLGQQYCPSLLCQILNTNTRVRLMRKCAFPSEVSPPVA